MNQFRWQVFKCQFTASEDFASAVLDLDRHRFDLSAAEFQKDHSDQLELLRNPKADSEQVSNTLSYRQLFGKYCPIPYLHRLHSFLCSFFKFGNISQIP